MTIASSTTKPTASVSASSDRLSRLKPSAYIAAKVPMTEISRASAGMTVAETLRRKSRMTRMTSAPAMTSVTWTSSTALADRDTAVVERRHLDRRRQIRLETRQDLLDRRTVSIVLAPGWRWMARTIARLSTFQLAMRWFSTPSIGVATSSEPNRRAVAPGDDQRPIVGGGLQLAVIARSKMPAARRRNADGWLTLACGDRLLQLVDAEIAGDSWSGLVRCAPRILRPKTSTCATPATVDQRCASCVSAYSLTTGSGSVGEERAMK